MKIEHYYKVIPLLHDIDESGDLAIVKEDKDYYYLGLIDGLGHGVKANIAANIAIDYLDNNFSTNLDELIIEINERLFGTVGVVMALCCINKDNGEMIYSGIGNISVRNIGKKSFRCNPRDGIVGYSMPSPKIQYYKLNLGDLLLMYSDGVKEHFDLIDLPGIQNESVENITETLIDKYSKINDDISMITCKVK